MDKYTIELKPVERVDLLRLIGGSARVQPLKEHYDKNKIYYDEWARNLQQYTFRLENSVFSFSIDKVVNLLATQIAEYDGKLYRIVSVPAFQEEINLDHTEICRLFAKNSVASNGVAPGESHAP